MNKSTKSPDEPARARRDVGSCLLLAVALLALSQSPRLLALDVPPAPTRWYTDSANLLNVTEATALDQKLRAFEERSGAQFMIYVFPTLDGDPLEDFTIRCAAKWKAGQKKYDNGLILFIAVKERKSRIEVGYGLEGTVTDAFASDVLRNDITPHFRGGDYAGGLNAAADDLIARIEKKEAPVPVARSSGSARRSSRGIDPMFIFAIIIVFFFFILPLLRRGGRGGGCGGCIPIFLPWGGSGMTFGGGGFGGGGGGWGGGGGGFSGGGGGFGGGGASGGW